jgi:alkylated DNA repair dioxygenase AlkB
MTPIAIGQIQSDKFFKVLTMSINRDGRVDYFPGIFPTDQNYFERLKTLCDWREEIIRVRGKWYVVSRKTAWYGDANYGYSGQVKVAQPWLPILVDIRSVVQEVTGESYNAVLLNYYPDGFSKTGWHSDNQRDLVPGAAIASVSFGATRRFDLRHQDGEKHSIDLEDRSVLLMSGELQNYWKHSVPVQKKVKEPRINLTFRKMVTKQSK